MMLMSARQLSKLKTKKCGKSLTLYIYSKTKKASRNFHYLYKLYLLSMCKGNIKCHTAESNSLTIVLQSLLSTGTVIKVHIKFTW